MAGEKPVIFDPVRKKWVRLIPEEWVRQNTIRYLQEVLGYPLSHMAVEKSLRLNRLTKRADILIYDSRFNPMLLIECKAPDVVLNAKVMEQISRYNLIFKVPWLFVTNGMKHFCSQIDHTARTMTGRNFLPSYSDLAGY